jgi:hypothetical protein
VCYKVSSWLEARLSLNFLKSKVYGNGFGEYSLFGRQFQEADMGEKDKKKKKKQRGKEGLQLGEIGTLDSGGTF